MTPEQYGTLPHLTALEHETVPISSDGSATSLSAAEAESLMRIAEVRRGFCERRYGSVRLAQHCGVVNLGRRMLEVLPKVGPGEDAAEGRGVLLRLLRASAVHEAVHLLPAAQRLERTPLLEIFVAAFMDAVTEIVRGGLRRQYTEQEDDLRVVRGRIALGRQFGAHFNRPDLIAVRYDEHTADNRWNRPIKAALRACRPWIVSNELHRRWIELIAAFEDVADVAPLPGELGRLVFDRQGARYRSAMEWARWILALLSPAMRAGDTSAPAFLFDMNRVFELAVENVLRRRIEARGIELHAQYTGRYLARLQAGAGRRAYGLKPDLVVRHGRTVRLIADAKWKRVEVTPSGELKPGRADVYQMHAYAAAFGVDRLALIYPAHRGTAGAATTAFALPPHGSHAPTLSVACIDVHHDNLPIVNGSEAFAFLSAPRLSA